MTISDSERLARIETKLDEVLKPLQETVADTVIRVTALEQFRAYAKGAAAVIALILGMFSIERFIK